MPTTEPTAAASPDLRDKAFEIAKAWLRKRGTTVDGEMLAFMVDYGVFLLSQSAAAEVTK